MSAKVGRLKPGQPATSKPYRYVSKVVAAYLIRSAVCEYAGKRLIRDREASESRLVLEVRQVDPADSGQLLAPRGPETLLIHYPIAEQRTVNL